jgi:hypothetical protein
LPLAQTHYHHSKSTRSVEVRATRLDGTCGTIRCIEIGRERLPDRCHNHGPVLGMTGSRVSIVPETVYPSVPEAGFNGHWLERGLFNSH